MRVQLYVVYVYLYLYLYCASAIACGAWKKRDRGSVRLGRGVCDLCNQVKMRKMRSVKVCEFRGCTTAHSYIVFIIEIISPIRCVASALLSFSFTPHFSWYFSVCSSSCFGKCKVQCKHLFYFFIFVKRDITGGSIDSKIPTILLNTLVQARWRSHRSHSHKSLYFSVSLSFPSLTLRVLKTKLFEVYEKTAKCFSLFKQCVVWFRMLNV